MCGNARNGASAVIRRECVASVSFQDLGGAIDQGEDNGNLDSCERLWEVKRNGGPSHLSLRESSKD